VGADIKEALLGGQRRMEKSLSWDEPPWWKCQWMLVYCSISYENVVRFLKLS